MNLQFQNYFGFDHKLILSFLKHSQNIIQLFQLIPYLDKLRLYHYMLNL